MHRTTSFEQLFDKREQNLSCVRSRRETLDETFRGKVFEAANHPIRAMTLQFSRPLTVDPQHQPKATSPSGLNTGNCVFHHGGITCQGICVKFLEALNKNIGLGFASKIQGCAHNAINDCVE